MVRGQLNSTASISNGPQKSICLGTEDLLGGPAYLEQRIKHKIRIHQPAKSI